MFGEESREKSSPAKRTKLRYVSIVFVCMLIPSLMGPMVGLPTAAAPPSWLAEGKYLKYETWFYPIQPPDEPGYMIYNITITQVTAGTVSYHENYSSLNKSSGVEVIEFSTTFNTSTRKIIEPTWFGDYYTWLWIQDSDIQNEEARLTDKNFTLIGASMDNYIFEAREASGNYTLMMYSINELKLVSGNGTIIWGNKSAKFTTSLIEEGFDTQFGGESKSSGPINNSSNDEFGILGLVYSFNPPYHSQWADGGWYNTEGCWSAYYSYYAWYYNGKTRARSGAHACSHWWYSRVFSYAYGGIGGPSGGYWKATQTEDLWTKWRYYMDVFGLVFVSIPWWGGAASASSKVTLSSQVREYGTGYLVSEDYWTIFNFKDYGYTDWYGYSNRYRWSYLVDDRYYYFRFHLSSDTRAAVIWFGGATAAADVWATSQYVQFWR